MEYKKIDGQNFYNMVVNASNKLEEQKEYVNSLNVFPVPDGDTGTNMSMTFREAVSEIENIKSKSIGEVSKIFAKGALMGARGNSGVILSQILRGIAKALEQKDEVTAVEFAESISEGSKSAYKAVMRPTEGTILTIIRSAGESALKSENENITDLLYEVCSNAEDVLNKTPDMLPALKKAKVVDAGGMGLLIIFKGMYEALLNGNNYTINNNNQSSGKTYSQPQNVEKEEIKYGYCTEFFILGKDINLDEFKKEIEPQGDSMIVVGVDDVVKVHIHTNDPGKILSAALNRGDLSKVKIDNMREQHRKILESQYPVEESIESNDELKKYAFISVALGDGIRDIFKDLGTDFVIEGGQTMNPSTEEILNCINKINAENIFILPNNKNIIMSATQAKELSDKNVVVIPSKTIPQGITALTLFNADEEVEDNIKTITEGISTVISGQVTYAVRDTEIDGKLINQGNILGILDGKIKEVGTSCYDICEKMIDDIYNDDISLITILYGKETDESKVNELINKLTKKYHDVDIQCYFGKQPLYYFIFSIE
ncbi:MAG: DAK2 domain-containing protein [Bacillota bacterium]|nr:DAK2 domain-containing protein [Bacillota bacterium]